MHRSRSGSIGMTCKAGCLHCKKLHGKAGRGADDHWMAFKQRADEELKKAHARRRMTMESEKGKKAGKGKMSRSKSVVDMTLAPLRRTPSQADLEREEFKKNARAALDFIKRSSSKPSILDSDDDEM